MTPTERFIKALSSHNCDPRCNGKGKWLARCPAHDDQNPSLSIREGDDGKVLVHCFAGCPTDEICSGVGHCLADLMPLDATFAPSHGNGKGRKRGRLEAEYDYRDEGGDLLFQVLRYSGKGFRQRRPDANGGWKWSVKGVRVVPYRLPELRADASDTVFVVEGEKDVENLRDIGLVATCNAGGAGKWTAEHSSYLRGRQVVILPDNDEAGHKHAQSVAVSLHGIAESIKIVHLPDLQEKGDVSDWIVGGGSKAELERLVAASCEWGDGDEAWEKINSFDSMDLPEFPTHALPRVLQDFVEEESHATQTPPDLAAMLVLSVCAAAIAGRVYVRSRAGHVEPVNLFAIVLLGPGNRKSAVFRDAMKPLSDLEKELMEDTRSKITLLQSARRRDETRLKQLEKIAATKREAEALEEANELSLKLSKEPVPVLPRLIVDDATAEKLGIMLLEQNGRIASMSPEGGVFDQMAGLYSRNGMPQIDVYLKGHAGDALMVDRVSRESVRVEKPALTCAYAVQPGVISNLAKNPVFRDRGLLGRFLYSAPKSWIGVRAVSTKPMSDATRELYERTVRALYQMSDEVDLGLNPEAETVHCNWAMEVEQMMAEGERLESMHDWAGKLVGATLRLAGVMHSVQYGATGCIATETLRAAIAIARYLIPHAEATLNSIPATKQTLYGDARYVLRWILRHDRREFTKRDAQQGGKRRFPKADDIDPALAELVRRRYIRRPPDATDGPGRPPSPAYEVNPAVYEVEDTKSGSQDSEDRPNAAPIRNSENIENGFPPCENEIRIPKSPNQPPAEPVRETESTAANEGDLTPQTELAAT